jgi:hypothetical protein
MIAILIIVAFFIVPIVWLALKFAPWSAPVSGVIGLVILTMGLIAGAHEVSLFGFGLFVFSALVFTAGGGMVGR